ncbi:MAG: C40 family peptidase [Tsuneonella suprasediminis]|uniref:Peptidoglycan endopeptidase n=1 Tax=Tsuneonella suprasediminis TaxID=2306996 RepID=A0A419QY97_9SPHN|nr:C40 family peptidase [Tsuneonella suprasediminis]RJX65661.1 peptidoglycan endopeptidase [Tsuneonella suprasediminis]UBS33512.1 C40 family peptidase [Altererythrobacter sp. N1]
MTGDSAARIAQAAERLVGVPFRLHGRDPASGLDCVGVVGAALSAARGPVELPIGYALRNTSSGDYRAWAARAGLIPASGPVEPGDILLVRPGPAQLHLLVAVCGDRFVHAHVGLRRVVATPGAPQWPVAGCWCLPPHLPLCPAAKGER